MSVSHIPIQHPRSVICHAFVLLSPGYRSSRVGRVCLRKAVWVQEKTSRAEEGESPRLSAVAGRAAVARRGLVGSGSRVRGGRAVAAVGGRGAGRVARSRLGVGGLRLSRSRLGSSRRLLSARGARRA
jgi:hypothetical protein